MQDAHRDLPEASGETDDGVWPYVGVGCLTAMVGFFGTGMIAVLLSKIVGYATGCAADLETGAPCHWFTYAVRGGLIGLILLPSFTIWRMRRKRAANKKLWNSE